MKIKVECPTDFLDCDLSGFEVADNPEVLICNPGANYRYDDQYLSHYPDLRFVATPSTGVNHIDTAYCQEHQIRVLCLLDNREALEEISASAEFTWLHIMNAVRNFHTSVEEVRRGNWRNKEGELRGHELSYLTLGIIGMGRIGRKLVSYASVFNMTCQYHDPYVDGGVDLDSIAQCNVIAVCTYLTDETTGMIDARFLSQCKPGTIVVNTSRGEVVNEDDVYNAVVAKQIRYYADVVCNEQNIDKFFHSRLYYLCESGEVCITPHIAGATTESQQKAFDAVLDMIRTEIKSG